MVREVPVLADSAPPPLNYAYLAFSSFNVLIDHPDFLLDSLFLRRATILARLYAEMILMCAPDDMSSGIAVCTNSQPTY